MKIQGRDLESIFANHILTKDYYLNCMQFLKLNDDQTDHSVRKYAKDKNRLFTRGVYRQVHI